jgi:hypothetical protein
VHSRFSESWLFDIPFIPIPSVAVGIVCKTISEFSRTAGLWTCVSDMTVLSFNRLYVLLCELYNVLCRQNTTVFRKWYIEYYMFRPLCIGHPQVSLNPLNAELNPIYHLLILLGD